MMAFNEIQKHYSEAENRLPRMVLKEYLQYKILEIIFSSKFGDKIIFMGGTSVRIVYGNDRFSEDLDLDNCGLTKKDFAALMEIIKRELKMEGIEAEIRNTYQNVYHCYLKFPDILFNNNLPPLKDEKILIQIDSFCVKEKIKPEIKIISKADIFTEAAVYPADVILSQKISAILHRKRSKGRDIYDLIYLFSLARPNWEYLKKSDSIANMEELKNILDKKYSDKDLEQLSIDVEPFLINPRKVIQIKKFNAWLKNLCN
ncbi:nucleotidyl transferase AbiEii/AbiGii toxin family protein [Patescibacteria group bacterium]|nr:nucleotidyl transferase AbiEii/AbiGii toxin family protein [Patescibacteria group bacterium]MBU4601084.1 nucleotidyl transferase AbiEii/AbiGii toxin family protein [Patescibacteria group bacterium]MCG2698202.1 nucleotidyl transferase AbiEii/AbiGii toxin family protein [Candidatus Parcubacteria bacterium]